ncbi:metallophosphoesterase [Halosquirtibacter xylanolyticus]|uniref:metallophosphoesterase n=1 Tax=Halosquirtibacter xylanolyticus TaxID=3374599 RepID=UPI0037496933|nr:metallophosphoesterase [Prolixibacteraceae bacterium]
MRPKLLFYFLIFHLTCHVATAKKRLLFHGTHFRVVQLTDMHLDRKHPSLTDYFSQLNQIIYESQANLLFLTGDIVCSADAEDGWLILKEWLDKLSIPFAFVMGNHDPENLEKSKIYEILSSSSNAYCYYSYENKAATPCYALPIYHQDKIVWNLWGIDSGSISEDPSIKGYDWVRFSTMEILNQKWKCHIASEDDQCNNNLMFLHIPMPEYAMATKRKYRDIKPIGTHRERVCAPRINSGLFYYLWEHQFKGVFVGHDHDNDYVAQMYGIPLVYGRRTGKNTCYGKMRMGVRVIELNIDSSYRTWIIDSKLKHHHFVTLPHKKTK